MNKKIIGIVAWRTSPNVIGVTLPYMRFISHFGNPRLILPADVDTFDPTEYDMIILPGGGDVNPARYGEIPSPDTGNHDIYKEFFDLNMLSKAVEANTLLFGICRGLQSLNVFLGGKLKQHINTNIHGSNGTDREKEIHGLVIDRKIIPNQAIHGISDFKVNSIHHQVVTLDTLAKNLIPIAVHDNIKSHVEAFIHKDLNICAVQWHPEELQDLFTVKLINYYLNKIEHEHNSIKKLTANLKS